MNTRRHLAAACAALIITALWIACSDSSPPSYQPPPECNTAADCPLSEGIGCSKASCIEGICELELLDISYSQYRGNCELVRCRSGRISLAVDLNDFYDDGKECTDDICDGGNSRNPPRPPGPAPSGSGFCDRYAHLVDCLADADCNDPTLYCSPEGSCVPLACKNRTLDPDVGESDVNCGGRCDPCRQDLLCNNGEDCINHVCGPDKTCARPRCDDGVRNGDETDIDCGAECLLCPDGAKCRGPRNCASNYCWAGRCQPRTCEDGAINGQEENVDCGGDCPPCP